MLKTFHLPIEKVAALTGTQIAGLLRGLEILNLKETTGAKEGGKIASKAVKYGKIKPKGAFK